MAKHTDHELLTLAAKAAAVPAYWGDDGTIQQRPVLMVRAGGGMGTMPYEVEWNPLRDDGDAFRLAVKLHLQIDPAAHAVAVGYGPCRLESLQRQAECMEGAGTDAYAATRRAIVRAAASMGEGNHG